jgi:hypothetical protein
VIGTWILDRKYRSVSIVSLVIGLTTVSDYRGLVT